MTSNDHEVVPLKVGLSGVVTLFLVIVVLAGSVFYSLPSNVMSTRDGGAVRSFSGRFMPQSWAFFTKPPSDPEFVPYRVHADGHLEFASLMPNSRSSNLFGLGRKQRAQGPEIAKMANQVTDWVDCSEAKDDCLAETASGVDPLSVTNSSPVATLCGMVLLVETEPVPWAFRADYDGWRLERRAALVEGKCQ